MRLLIYGATKGRGDGLGRAAAVVLQQRGHEVRGLCRDAAKATLERDFPLEAIDIAGSGAKRLKAIVQEFDPDVIWSACGAGFGEPLWTLGVEPIEQMIDANVRNNILFSRICAPSCLDGGPHLILTGSVAGAVDGIGASVYSGVKGFLLPFVRGQRAEYARAGHNAKISLLMLPSVRAIGMELVTDAVEFIGAHSRAMELLVD